MSAYDPKRTSDQGFFSGRADVKTPLPPLTDALQFDTLQLFATRHRASEMWGRSWKPFVIVLPWVAIVLAVLYIIYRLVDPLPPRHFAIAAGIPGTGYDVFARQYARILARDGVDLEVRNYASAIEHFDVLRDATSPVQAALTTFGFTQPSDAATLYSLGGISDTRYSFFTETRSLLRGLHNSVASALPSACREPPCERLCWTFWRPLAHWMIPSVCRTWITARQSMH
jgi:hypothetical protein